MPRTVEVLVEATAEAAESREGYESRDAAAGARFVHELDAAIVNAPDRWPVGRRGTRRYLLRRFPFGVVYTFDDDRVRIIAIARSRRRPGYWEERT